MTAPDPAPCDAFREDARAYLDGELAPDARRRVEAHASTCAACRDELASLVQTLTALDEALGAPTASVRDRVLGRLEAAPLAFAPNRPLPGAPSMPKLQACPKCGAQFDVSAMAAGSKFTCGACGQVLTAGIAAAPVAPSRAVPPPVKGRAPAAPAGQVADVGGRRGPQYRPPERAQESKPVPTARAERGASDRGGGSDRAGGRERSARGERGGGRPAKKGLSPAAMAGIGAGVVVLAVGAFFMMGKQDEPKPSGVTAAGPGGAGAGATPGMGASGPAAGMGAAAPSVSTDTVASLDTEWKAIRNATPAQYREFMRRFAAAPGGTPNAKVIAASLLKEADPNDKDARTLLGHKEFAYKVPEEISFTKYPFIRAVEEAAAQRWFEDDEAYALAMTAYDKTLKHAERLASDRVYTALDVARRQIDKDEYFKNYNYDAIFASPYLICYSSNERIDPEAMIKLPKAERSKKLAELEKKRESYQKLLAEKAKIYTQLYAEFMKRYAEDCELKDLMAEFGGRPDYPPTKRSFREGCPLIVWIFSDKNAFNEYHEKVKGESIDKGVAGYFSPMTGWVYLYDEEGSDREFEINKNVHEGTHQLEHWFTRQKNEWGPSRVPQSFFGEGFAEYTGSVIMAPDRTLKFVGINRPRLQSLQQMKQQLGQTNKKMYVFPLKTLVEFEGYHNVRAWGAANWGIDAIFVFYIQSWAFVYFLNEWENHKYQERFTQFVDDMLNHPKDSPGYGFEMFQKRLGISTDADWKKLDVEFGKFYDGLMKMDDDKVGPKPPGRDDWPGYVPPGEESASTPK